MRGRFADAWAAILRVDYRPVFETARVALSALPSDADSDRIVYGLARVVEQIAARAQGFRHDLLGRVFHRVIDTARFDGSFYTSTAAATLLAALAIRAEDCDWADVNAVARLRICDPACGTGTLLMAAAERIRSLRHSAGAADAEDEAALALCLVEDVLWGYDINLTAAHMAASALGMLSPTTSFGKMRIYRTLLGVYEGVPYLGSLEFLAGQPRLLDWPKLSEQVDADAAGPAPESPPPMDLVIMNPPFTRDSLRHDQFPREVEQAIKRREKQVIAGLDDPAAARLAGSANAFMVLGEQLSKAAGSILAMVLPTVIATNPAAFATRTYLARKFHIDAIVSSHDPERINMSENTSIGEVLIICRRWNSKEPKPPTRFINLAENPAAPIDSLDLARRLQRRGPGPFTLQDVSAARIERGDWNAVNFLSPHLVEAYRSLAESPVFIQLSEIAQVGPDSRAVRGAYTRSAMPASPDRRALWYHKTGVTQSMLAAPDVYIEAKPEKHAAADALWARRGRFFLSYKLRLPLARVAAVILPHAALSSIWITCTADDAAAENSLCAYLNSSLGILAVLGGRDNRVPSYPQFSLETLRSIPVPNLPALGGEARGRLAAAFEELKEEVLLPLPRMDEDPVRRRLDEAVIDALDLDPEWVAGIRRALAEDPCISNRRFRA